MKFIIIKSKQFRLQEMADKFKEYQIYKKQIKSSEYTWGGLSCNHINPEECAKLAKLEKSAKLALHKLWKSRTNTKYRTPQNVTISGYLTNFSKKCCCSYEDVCKILSPLDDFYVEYYSTCCEN